MPFHACAICSLWRAICESPCRTPLLGLRAGGRCRLFLLEQPMYSGDGSRPRAPDFTSRDRRVPRLRTVIGEPQRTRKLRMTQARCPKLVALCPRYRFLIDCVHHADLRSWSPIHQLACAARNAGSDLAAFPHACVLPDGRQQWVVDRDLHSAGHAAHRRTGGRRGPPWRAAGARHSTRSLRVLRTRRGIRPADGRPQQAACGRRRGHPIRAAAAGAAQARRLARRAAARATDPLLMR
jgi:hypothetical protein